MQHLGKVNQLLVALGAAPTLIREDSPYEPDIYPFRFSLEPVSRHSLAKYVWTESPPGEIDAHRTLTATHRAFHSAIELALGGMARPNYDGTLYDKVIAVLEEFAASGQPQRPIPRDELQEGDFVFFNTRNKPFCHVGICVGEDRFVHAPSRNGKIELANLSDRYFDKRFDSARTLLRK